MENKIVNLESVMKEYVDKYCENYKSDLEYDIRIIKDKNENKTFYWLLRQNGTQIYDESIFIKESCYNKSFKYYYDNCRALFKIVITDKKKSKGTITKITKKKLLDMVESKEKDATEVEVNALIVLKDNSKVNIEIPFYILSSYSPYSLESELERYKIKIDEVKSIYQTVILN